MKINRFKAVLLLAIGLSCAPAWAAMSGADSVPIAGRQIAPPAGREPVVHPAATSDETLIHLHRAAVGVDFLAPASVGAASHCCEPSRASR